MVKQKQQSGSELSKLWQCLHISVDDDFNMSPYIVIYQEQQKKTLDPIGENIPPTYMA